MRYGGACVAAIALTAALTACSADPTTEVYVDPPLADAGPRDTASIDVEITDAPAVDAARDVTSVDVPRVDAVTDVARTDAVTDAPRTDAEVVCPMPAPLFIVLDGRCIPSCMAAGGNTCSPTLCAGLTRIESWDCANCCAVAPPDCGGVSANWTCTSSGNRRQRCVSGQVQSETCAGACIPAGSSGDATCGAAPSTCTGSASGNSPVWTCTADRSARQRCVSSAVQTERCTNGCVESAVGVDDVCGTGCSSSASGTSSIWTCTADRRSRQRCVSNAVQTESCASGCTVMPTGVNDVCASAATGCSGSASGTTAIWTCTADRSARQRCVSGSTQTEACTYGCTAMPTGTDDVCNPMPSSGSGSVSCSLPQWWNLAFSWSPGVYTVRYGWDNDLRMAAGTGVQLRHASRLIAEGVYDWGWMPEFQDTVTGYRFRFLHLQPSRRLTTAVGTTYPAGTLVGYSGGSTADTGYPTYSTGAHLCVQTTVSYRTAFPMGVDACR